MSIVVVDASIATKWYVSEAGSDEAVVLYASDHALHAPDLIYPEVANTLMKKRALGEIDADMVARAIANLLAVDIQSTPAKQLMSEALVLSMDMKLAVYDGLYVALARRLGAELATEDRALRRAAERLNPKPIPIWRP